MTGIRFVCRLDDLPDGGARGLDLNGDGEVDAFAVRRAGTVHLWVDACPHHGTPLPWRKDAYLNAAGDRIVCAAHGALFELDSGRCVQGPCLGERLTPVPCAVVADGEVVLVEGFARTALATGTDRKPSDSSSPSASAVAAQLPRRPRLRARRRSHFATKA
jgi:nitrite reductase/ring-hydroxylating ferredoxin subunit